MSIGRFAPSPTGRLHVGNLRTALAAWLFSRCEGSEFFLRFEDLDANTADPEHFETQRRDLAAIGLDWDKPVLTQSERLELYQTQLNELKAKGVIYQCFCSRREIREAASAPNHPHAGHLYPGTCRTLSTVEQSQRALTRPPALRLRAESVEESFVDLISGNQTFEIDDFVLQRNDGTPAYHLAVVVDDNAQNIELVVRADDLLPSAARQQVLYRYFDWVCPTYAHVPLVLAQDGERLAKRHGAVSLTDRQNLGETTDELVHYLVKSLGFNETFTDIAELLGRFDESGLAAQISCKPLYLDADYLST